MIETKEKNMLSKKTQRRKRGKDGKSRSLLCYYYNDVLILTQKFPFEDNYEEGFNHRTHITGEYILNNILYQNRTKFGKSRDVKFPLSKKLNLPNNIKIEIRK